MLKEIAHKIKKKRYAKAVKMSHYMYILLNNVILFYLMFKKDSGILIEMFGTRNYNDLRVCVV